jgi:hypothetical protein
MKRKLVRWAAFAALGFLLTEAGFRLFGQQAAGTAAGTASVTFAWQLSPSPIIVRQTFGYGQVNGAFTNLTTVGATVTTFTLTSLAYGTTYYFAVSCTDSNNLTSQWSVPLQYTTTNAPPPTNQPPPAPTGLKVLSVP